MFCSGHVSLADGEALVVGGTSAYQPVWKGAKAVYTFSFATRTFTRRSDLLVGRWYPTATIQPDGNVLITGGLDEMGVNTGTSRPTTR
jgi:hypothetical protein